jgi:ribosomal protein L7Ae-like RNA K-turn-binding protein
VTAPALDTLGQEIGTLLHTRLETCVQLARKAGAVVSGYTALQRVLAHGRVLCLVVAIDTAVARAENYRAWCERHRLVCVRLFSKEELGRLMGKPSRSAIGFTQRHFAERLQTLLAAAEQWRTSHSASEGRTAFFYTAS